MFVVGSSGLGQLFVVSRFLQKAGVRAALLVLPLIAFGGYGALVFAPVLPLVFAAKIAENGLDYSLASTTRQALYLPTSRAHKFQGKAVVDTFLVRAGDVVASGVVFVASTLGLGVRAVAGLNLAFVAAHVAIALVLGRRHDALVGGGRTSA